MSIDFLIYNGDKKFKNATYIYYDVRIESYFKDKTLKLFSVPKSLLEISDIGDSFFPLEEVVIVKKFFEETLRLINEKLYYSQNFYSSLKIYNIKKSEFVKFLSSALLFFQSAISRQTGVYIIGEQKFWTSVK